MPLRCHCRATLSPNANTMPKLASAVNIPSHAQSSHSSGGMARASLNDEDAWEDDFQTLHMPVHCVVWGRTAAVENQLMEGWKPPGEALAGDRVTRWILVKRSPCLRPSTLPGEPPTGFSWQSRASQMTRCPGMNWPSP